MSFFTSDRLRLVHSWIVVPATLSLVFLIGPLGAADEQMHLYRADAISHGVVAPRSIRLPSGERGAGGSVDASLRDWSDRFVPIPDSEIAPTSRRALLSTMDAADAGFTEEQIHSNTAIYPPILYAQSAFAIFVARVSGMPIGTWLYAARLANAIVAIGIVSALIRAMPALRPLLLIISALPVMLYQTATLSADAVLLPLSVAFACLLARLSMSKPQNATTGTSPVTGPSGDGACTVLLALSMLVICAGKVAYLPFAVLPPLVARLVDGRWTARASGLLVTAIGSLVLWACWAWIVHDKVFTIRPDIPVDPVAQLSWMMGHPLEALVVFGRALVKNAAWIGYTSVGSHLGNLNFRISHALILFGMAALVVVTVWSSLTASTRPRGLLPAVWIVAASVALIIPLLLYLQYNAVGQSTIEGLQGRYFLPILFLVIPFVPRMGARVNARLEALLNAQIIHAVAAVFAIASAAYMVWRASQSYWTS